MYGGAVGRSEQDPSSELNDPKIFTLLEVSGILQEISLLGNTIVS